MIIDTLDNLEQYVSLNPLFKEVIEFLKKNDLKSFEPGIHKIQGNDVFVNVQVAKGKTKEEAVMEYHKAYVDIQIPLSANETYGYIPACDLPEAEFNEEKDIAKIPNIEPLCYATCRPGTFVMFFPQDGHAPFISDETELKKAIFKIKIS